jgi:hypothetical protein
MRYVARRGSWLIVAGWVSALAIAFWLLWQSWGLVVIAWYWTLGHDVRVHWYFYWAT